MLLSHFVGGLSRGRRIANDSAIEFYKRVGYDIPLIIVHV